jgi:molecular chaperone GrpE
MNEKVKKATTPQSKSKKRPTKTQLEIKKLEQQKEELNEKLLRKAAEFDNYRRRTEREFLDRIKNANERLITDLLPVLDDFDRLLEHSIQNAEVESVFEGFELVQKKFFSILQKEGLEIMPAKGETFDPEKHDALMQQEAEDSESGTVLDEHLRGYLLNGKVIRHAQVIVAK